MKATTSWLTIEGKGHTCQPDGAVARRSEPVQPMPIARVLPVAPNAQLVVASLADAGTLESASAGDEPFAWSELSAADVSHLVALQCITEGVDPNAPLEGVPPKRNLFTGEMIRLTAFDRAFESLEVVLAGELVAATPEELDGQQPDALVFRLPPSFVARLAALSAGAIAELADRWTLEGSARSSAAEPFTASAAVLDLEALVAAARSAAAHAREVFVWMAC